MQIEFTNPTDVDHDQIPRTAWGKLARRTITIPPSFKPLVDAAAKGESLEGVKPTPAQVIPQEGWYFRKGSIVDLPDEMATKFIAEGVAKAVENPDSIRRNGEIAELADKLAPKIGG